jgi:hypothetical protein
LEPEYPEEHLENQHLVNQHPPPNIPRRSSRITKRP